MWTGFPWKRPETVMSHHENVPPQQTNGYG